MHSTVQQEQRKSNTDTGTLQFIRKLRNFMDIIACRAKAMEQPYHTIRF